MSKEQPKHSNTIAHPDTTMEKKKSNFRQRLLQFLSKMFWHLNQPVAPTYGFINRSTSTSSSRRSFKKPESKSPYQISPITRTCRQHQYTPRHQPGSIRPRTVTLTSIQEE